MKVLSQERVISLSATFIVTFAFRHLIDFNATQLVIITTAESGSECELT